MTGEEIKRRYCIPDGIFEEYESRKAEQNGCPESKQDSDFDLELLSRIMTLHETGFEKEQVKAYLDFAEQGAEGRRKCSAMLQRQRKALLEQIHRMEQMLERLDYLRYEAGKRE